MFVRWMSVACCLLLAVGCTNKGYTTFPVSGTVKFSDGSVPVGEYKNIIFEPVAGGPGTKGAQGMIENDGKFTLSTIEPNDGAFPGEYKVIFQIYKTYGGQESAIPAKYADVATTPFTVKVGPQEKNKHDFVLDKQ
jgi:hypothetical protein